MRVHFAVNNKTKKVDYASFDDNNIEQFILDADAERINKKAEELGLNICELDDGTYDNLIEIVSESDDYYIKHSLDSYLLDSELDKQVETLVGSYVTYRDIKSALDKLEKLLLNGIISASKANDEFEKANNAESKESFEFLRLQAMRKRGYAEGIFEALNAIEYKHEHLNTLRNLL